MSSIPEHPTDGPDVAGQESGGGYGEAGSPSGGARSKWFQRFLIDAARSVIVTLAILLVLRALAIEAFKIPTSSMEGTLLAGDFLLVNKAVYGADIPGLGVSLPAFAEPGLGDVIVFHPPHHAEKYYVKRVVGIPGDTLEMRGKQLFRNSRPVSEPYARHIDPDGDAVHPGMRWQGSFLAAREDRRRYRPSRDTWGPLVVPADRYFVLGDNRDNSEDSRYWGFVTRESVTGRPWIVYYSSEVSGNPGLPIPWEVRWDRIGGRVQ